MRFLIAALVVVTVLLGLQTLRLSSEEAAHATTRREHAEQIASAERAAREAVTEAREEERRRYAELEVVVRESEKKLDQARADAAAASDAGRRLRDQIAAVTARCRAAASGSASSEGGAPTDRTADLLADVQRRLDEAADGIARHADEAGTAGAACERAYDALR